MRNRKASKLILYIMAKLGWGEIQGFAKHYYCSPDGENICSVKPNGKLFPLQQYQKKDGYKIVKLKCADGSYKNKRVNRLIAQTFIPNPENKRIAHHKNHDRGDNRKENLGWYTCKENALDRKPKGDDKIV